MPCSQCLDDPCSCVRGGRRGFLNGLSEIELMHMTPEGRQRAMENRGTAEALEIWTEAQHRMVFDPAFAARYHLAIVIGREADRMSQKGCMPEEWPAIALVLAERKVTGGKREDDPSDLVAAVKKLLLALATYSPYLGVGWPGGKSSVTEAIQAVHDALGVLE
jgi:hypothetical protein